MSGNDTLLAHEAWGGEIMLGRSSVILIACLVLMSFSLNRGPVRYEVPPEAESTDGLRWGMTVPSCNGDPVVSLLVQGEEEVGVEVTTTTVNGRDCLDGISFTLDEPLGDRVLRDLVSGREFIVCGTVAPGQQAGGDVPCR